MNLGLCILGLVVSTGYHQCGLAALLSEQILSMRNCVGAQKIVKWMNSLVPSSWKGRLTISLCVLRFCKTWISHTV